MIIKVIKTEEDYNQALQRLEKIFHAPKDSIEGDEAEILTILIEKYEDENYPIEAPDPIEAILFRMEQMDMTKKDLADVHTNAILKEVKMQVFSSCSWAYCLPQRAIRCSIALHRA